MTSQGEPNKKQNKRAFVRRGGGYQVRGIPSIWYTKYLVYPVLGIPFTWYTTYLLSQVLGII